MRIFGWGFIFEKARKGTIWFHNIKSKPGTPRQRADKLISLERIWLRDHNVYLYELCVGPYLIIAANVTGQAKRVKEL